MKETQIKTNLDYHLNLALCMVFVVHLITTSFSRKSLRYKICILKLRLVECTRSCLFEVYVRGVCLRGRDFGND